MRSLTELSTAPRIKVRLHCGVAKKLDHRVSFAGVFTEIIELAVPARGIRFVFDLKPGASLSNDGYCRVGDIAIEKGQELASCPSAQSLHITRLWERRCEFSGSRFVWKARTSCSVGDMRSDVLVGAAAAVVLVACGFAHSADLRPVVSEPCCFQPNEQLHCLLRHCCDRRLQGRSTRLYRRNRACGVQLVTRPAKFWRKSEQPLLEKAIAADIANSSEVREGTYAAFPRQRAQFDYRPFDTPRGAGVEQALTPACCIRLSASV